MFELLLLLILVLSLSKGRDWLQRLIQAMVLLMGGDSFGGIMVYTLLFLPGILVHEISHFLTAAVLGVQTGDIHLFPRRGSEADGRIALGSVQVAKTDFVRGSLIGAAPFFVGCLLLVFLVLRFVSPAISFDTTSLVSGNLISNLHIFLSQPKHILVLYMIFSITNTMFMSKEDMRAFPVIGVFVGLLVIVLSLTHSLSWVLTVLAGYVQPILRDLNGTFLVALVIDLIMIMVLFVVVKIFEVLTKRKVVYGK